MIAYHRWTIYALLLTHIFIPTSASAEEGGSGHYTPGSMSSFIDSVPPAPAFITRLNVLGYDGSVSATTRLPFSGELAAGVDAKIRGYGITMVWRPAFIDLGPGWSYSLGTTIPLISSTVSATGISTGAKARTIQLHDERTGLGDVLIQPVMLSRIFNPDFKINSRLTIYLPTGAYDPNRLANTGKNFWTYSPSLEFMYFGHENGIEASVFFGIDFNTKNPDTDYKSGSQFHVDGTLAQHFPLLGGLAGGGISGYYYHQISGDSGAGASLGSFDAMTTGLGPALSYTRKIGNENLVTELKWLHEINTNNRLKGDTVFLKILVSF